MIDPALISEAAAVRLVKVLARRFGWPVPLTCTRAMLDEHLEHNGMEALSEREWDGVRELNSWRYLIDNDDNAERLNRLFDFIVEGLAQERRG